MFQGIVIGTGENSEFGEVFKMMQAEEVKCCSLLRTEWFILYTDNRQIYGIISSAGELQKSNGVAIDNFTHMLHVLQHAT